MAQYETQAKITAVDNVTGPVKKIMGNIAPLGRQMKSIGSAAKGIGNGIRNIFPPILGAASLFIGFKGIQGVVRCVKDMASLGDKVAKTADRIGFGIENFQKLSYVAEQSGISNEEFSSSLEFMNKNMGQLKAGTGPLVSALQKVSPALMEQIKSAKNNEEAFSLMTKAIRLVEDPAKKAYLATTFFGRSGQGMINFANQSEEAITDLIKKTEELGLIIGKKTARQSETFGDEMDNLNHSFLSISKTIASDLIPIFIPLIKKMTDFVNANRALISEKMGDIFKKLSKWIEEIDFKNALNMLSSFASFVFKIVSAITSSQSAFIGFIALMNAGLITSLMQTTAAVGKLVWMLIPFGAKTAVAKGAIGLFVKMMLEAKIATTSLGGSMSIFSKGMALATTAAKGLFSLIATNPAILALASIATVVHLIYKNFDEVKSFLSGFWDGFLIGIKPLTDAFKDLFSELSPLFEFFSNMFKSIGEVVGKIVDLISGFFKINTELSTMMKVGKILGAVFSSLLVPLEAVAMAASSVLKACSWVKGLFSGSVSNESDSISKKNNQMISQPSPIVSQMISATASQTSKSQAEVVVKFENMPRGASVNSESTGQGLDLGVETGYALQSAVR